MTKETELLELARKRQSDTYGGYTAIGDYDKGVWECDYVSPFSKSSHNVNSKILVILQDWCSSESFNGEVCQETLKLGYSPTTRTNINLIVLLKKYFNVELADIYTTNLFPYIKQDDMSAFIPAADLIKAAKEFTLPMIKIIQPKTIICCGLATFDAIRRAHGFRKVYSLKEGFKSTFKHDNSTYYCQAHPALRGKNIDSNIVVKNWEMMKKKHNANK